MIFIGAWVIGDTWDEPFHVQKLNNYLSTGWYLSPGQLAHGVPVASMTQQYVYAPATSLLLHGLNVLLGVEPTSAAEATARAYAVRHVGVALISLVGIFAVALTARLLLQRRDWSVVAAAAFASMPMWTGHSMFNPKDVPVATGYALATYGLALIAREVRGRDWRLRVAGPLTLAVGTILAVGTRPGMWTGLTASVVALVVCLVLRPREPEDSWFGSHGWHLGNLAVAALLAGGVLWVLDPKVFDSPVNALWNAAFSSANFLGTHAPWTFVPVRVFLQVPAILLGFIGLGVVLASRDIFRTRFRPGVAETRLILLLVQVFTMPVIAIVHGASLYGDLRQLLFAAPAAALLGTFGMARLLGRARRGADRTGPPLVAAAIAVGMVAPLVQQAMLFPYNYAYYNPLAAIARVHTDGEYYRASGREIARKVPNQGRVVCSPQGDRVGLAMRFAHLDGWDDCASAMSSPISPYIHRHDESGTRLRPEEFWTVSFNPSGEVPPNCRRISAVSRLNLWRRMYGATVSLCHRDFPVIGTKTEVFDVRSIESLDFPDLGWFVIGNDGTTTGIQARGDRSTMKFGMSKAFAHQAVRLLIRTAHEPRVRVSFDGVDLPVRTSRRPAGLEVTVPPDLVDRGIAEPRSLEFRPASGHALDLKVLSLKAAVAGR
jgi:hypothetical protein